MKPKRKVTKGTFDMEVDGKKVEVKGKLKEKFSKDGDKKKEVFKARGKDVIKKTKEVKKNKDGEMIVKRKKTVYK